MPSKLPEGRAIGYMIPERLEVGWRRETSRITVIVVKGSNALQQLC